MDNIEIEVLEAERPTSKAAGGVGMGHQPLEPTVVSEDCDMETLNVGPKVLKGPNDGQTFLLRRGIRFLRFMHYSS